VAPKVCGLARGGPLRDRRWIRPPDVIGRILTAQLGIAEEPEVGARAKRKRTDAFDRATHRRCFPGPTTRRAISPADLTLKCDFTGRRGGEGGDDILLVVGWRRHSREAWRRKMCRGGRTIVHFRHDDCGSRRSDSSARSRWREEADAACRGRQSLFVGDGTHDAAIGGDPMARGQRGVVRSGSRTTTPI